MEKINTGLSNEQRSGIVESLNRLLADEHVLYIKTRNYHWNVVGPRFHSLHAFFETQYTQLAEIIDEVAENARQFGGFACGTMTQYLQLARIREQPGRLPDEDGMLQDLVKDHESIIRSLREDIDRADEEFEAADAADFLTSVLEQHNKMAWMTRSHLTDIERDSEPELASVGTTRGNGRK
jgi:starvation-inducible DNA-binding protein